MVVKRIAACLLLISLAGCYRQAEDSFAPSSGGGDTQATPAGAATEVPLILETAIDTTPTIPIIMPTESEGNATDTGSASQGDATATIVIFEPPTRAAPTEESLRSDLPTATVPAVITPVLGNPLQVTLNPTTTGPTQAPSFAQTTPGAGGSDLQPTPTDLPTETSGECDYTIVSGDTLFRIALRNDVTLEDLLAANDLNESSILQLGQVITIPDCTPEGTILATSTATPASGIFLPTPTGVTTGGGTPGTTGTGSEEVYIVKPGDTLSKIAAQLNVEMQDIINANNLTNPNRLSIGQELIIPK
jgi:LysM repeat protein